MVAAILNFCLPLQELAAHSALSQLALNPGLELPLLVSGAGSLFLTAQTCGHPRVEAMVTHALAALATRRAEWRSQLVRYGVLDSTLLLLARGRAHVGHVAAMELLGSVVEERHLVDMELPSRATVHSVVAALRHLNRGMGSGSGMSSKVKAALVAYINALAGSSNT